MKKIILFAVLGLLTHSLLAETTINIFEEAPQIVVSGSGSGIGGSTIGHWDILYKTLEKNELADRLQRRVHRKYATAKGHEIGWKWTESAYLDELLTKPNTAVVESSSLAAWDNLYRNIDTEELRYFIRQSSHFEYANSKGWIIHEQTEEAYINRIKLLLSS